MTKDKCSICNENICFNYTPQTVKKMKKQDVCFNCLYWLERVKIADDIISVRIKGTQYILDDENSIGMRGFGGQRYIIKMRASGEEIVTTNMWYNGTIPSQFTRQLYDNADFIENHINNDYFIVNGGRKIARNIADKCGQSGKG